MDITVRHNPSFAVARAALGGSETIRVESGAMLATSQGVDVEAKMQGGFLKSLKRATLGGESLFVSTFTAPAQGGWIDVAANLPGDVLVADVPATGSLFIQRGSWLCSEASVELDTQWGGFKNLFGGEGGFLLRASGGGKVVMSCYGALDVLELGDGEKVTVDTGHMVAFEEGVQMQIRKITGGVIQSVKSGEGLVFDFTGPGKLMMQTRNPNALVEWLTTVLPFNRQ